MCYAIGITDIDPIKHELGDDLARARDLARQALQIDGESYEAAVTLAEVGLIEGRRTGEAAPLQAAAEALQTACVLAGCQNRVNLLTARVKLEAARQARRRGDHDVAQLDEILQMCRKQEEARSLDNEPWEELKVEAEREKAGGSDLA